MRVLGSFKVKAAGETISGTNSVEITGNGLSCFKRIDMNSSRIMNVANASSNTDAVNRQYADGRYTRGAYTISKSGGNFYIS